jgi:hypothetical protein
MRIIDLINNRLDIEMSKIRSGLVTYEDLQNFVRKVFAPESRLLRNWNTDPSDISFRAIVLVKYLIRSSSVSRHATRDARTSSKNLSYSTISVGAPSKRVNGTKFRKRRIR